MWKRTMVTVAATVALVAGGTTAADAHNWDDRGHKRTWCANNQPYGGWDEADQPGLKPVTGRHARWCVRNAR